MDILSAMAKTQLLFVFLSILFPIILLILRRRISKNIGQLPPGPLSWPLVGNLPQIGSMPHISFAKLSKTYGPLMSLRLGTKLVIVGSSPEVAEEIYKNQGHVFSGRDVPKISYASKPDLNHLSIGWTFECTEHWKFLRTLCRSELFAPKVINDQSNLREEKARELVDFLASRTGKNVKIAEFVFVSVFNFLANVFFSKDLLTFEEAQEGSGMSAVVREVMELFTAPNISDWYPFLADFDLQGLRKKADKCSKKIWESWKLIIAERRKAHKNSRDFSSQKDFLDVLLDNELSDDQINNLIMDLFVAGSDTSTSTIEWAMAELIKNERALREIREELDKEISGNVIKEVDLSRLSYLQACVKETLRLHPPAPLLLPRRALDKCQVMNFNIPKDTQILVNMWAITRDPSIWEDPLSFKPERFLNSSLDFKGSDFEFLPFGGGRRICPGIPLAARQVQLTLANIIHNFDWSLPNGTRPDQLNMTERFGITLQMKHPLVLWLQTRR